MVVELGPDVGAPEPSDTSVLVRFGLVADVQYADADDALSFHGAPRYYRESVGALKRALSGLSAEGVSFVLNLGDSVDGKQREAPEAGFDAVLGCFEGLPFPSYHLIGNHELYNLPRPELNKRLGIAPAGPYGGSYYSFVPHPSLRVVCLDSYDLSLLDKAQGPDHPLRIRADEVMAANPNTNKHMPAGLVGVQRRFVEFGGGVSDCQLAWLAGELAAAKAEGQRVIVAGHVPFCPGSCPNTCLLWNYDVVLDLLEGSGVVVATLAGHAHMNGYTLRGGIHHVVMPSILETPPGRDAFACVDVLPGALVLRGRDTCMSMVMRYQGAPGAPAAPPLPLAALAPWAAQAPHAAAGCAAEERRARKEGAGAPEAAVAVAVAARA